MLNEIIDRFARRRGYVGADDLQKAVTEAAEKAAQAAAPPELIAAVMTAFSTGIAPEKPYSALVDAYKSWVYTSIDKIGKTVATRHMHMFVYRRKSGEKVLDPFGIQAKMNTIGKEAERKYVLKEMGLEKQEIFDHPWMSLLQRPNGIMSRMVLWYETILRMELGGLCAWYMAPNGLGLPGEIWPLPLTRTAAIKPRVSGKLQIEEWIYEDGNVNERFQPRDVLALKYPNPASPFLGFSPLMAQTYPYDIDLFLMQQQRALFQNKGIPGIHFHTDQPLGKEQVTAILEQIREQWGTAVQSGRPMVTHSGLHADKTGFSNKDSMLTEVAKWAREKMITSYDLSEAKLGLEVPSNRANMEVLDETFEKECILPKCMLIEEQINTFALPRYDRGIFCEFERQDIGDREYDLRESEMEIKNFITTINDYLKRKGRPTVAWGDRPWIPLGVMQEGTLPVAPAPPAPPPPGKEAGTEEQKAAEAEKKKRLWHLFITRITPWESMVTGQMQGYFRQQGEDVIARLHRIGPRVEAQYAGWSRKRVQEHIAKKGVGDGINIDPAAEAQRLKLLFTPAISTMINAAGGRVLNSLGLAVSFNVNDPRTLQWIGARMDQFSEEVSGTTFDAINAVLRDGFTQGKPLSAIADVLRENFDSFERYRAPLIARTEVVAANNMADILAIRQSGVEDKIVKSWLTAGDENVRPSHVEAGVRYADGIPIDEDFQVGDDQMDAPGNGSDPSENIGCRCCLAYEKA